MLNETRKLFNSYTAKIALLNGVASVATMFSVEPSIDQKMENRIQQSSDFLQLINVVPVDAQKGEKVGVGVIGSIASRTDTSVRERNPKNVSSLDKDGYMAEMTEFDTFIPYSLIDSWRHHDDFQSRMRDKVINQIALDRLKIGFHGKTASKESNDQAHPMLDDLNIGWLEKIRQNAEQQHIDGVTILPEGGDYTNLDEAVLDAIDLLHETLQGNPNLVVITSYQLINNKYAKLARSNGEPTEKEALQRLLTDKRAGGLPVIAAPFFPKDAFLITTLSNLSIYWQMGTRRRHIEDNPKRNQVEDYQSVNEAYVVEEYEACAFVENIQFSNEGTEAQEGA